MLLESQVITISRKREEMNVLYEKERQVNLDIRQELQQKDAHIQHLEQELIQEAYKSEKYQQRLEELEGIYGSKVLYPTDQQDVVSNLSRGSDTRKSFSTIQFHFRSIV